MRKFSIRKVAKKGRRVATYQYYVSFLLAEYDFIL